MQTWPAAQCFGPIDLAERPDTTKQVFWNDQQVMKKLKKDLLLELLGLIFKSFLRSDHFVQLVWGRTL